MNESDVKLVVSDKPVLVGSIYERFTGFFDCPDRSIPITQPCTSTDEFLSDDINEIGFPDVLDLSDYWTNENVSTKSSESLQKDVIKLGSDDEPATKKSLFARAFDEINAMKKEKKGSRFKKIRQIKRGNEQNTNEKPLTKTLEQVEEEEKRLDKICENEAIKNLEIFREHNLDGDGTDEYSRLAMDAINLNFASKIMKNTVPRQEANIIRLFDSMKIDENKKTYEVNTFDEICNEAISRLEKIKELYVEHVQVEADRTICRFAADVNPIINGAWSFVPIRRVLDAVEQRSNKEMVSSDDVDICTLSLLWSVLLLLQKPTFFHVLSQSNEIFVRLAEIFLIGPELYQDNTVSHCVSILLNRYIFVKGQQNLLSFRLDAPIASLDAFAPFYEDLLKRFEEYSAGDVNFALFILIPAYMNSAIKDRLVLTQALWEPRKNVVRQMSLSKKDAEPILNCIKEWKIHEVEEQSYTQLLAMYAAAIHNNCITRERNPAVYEIASRELTVANDRKKKIKINEEGTS